MLSGAKADNRDQPTALRLLAQKHNGQRLELLRSRFEMPIRIRALVSFASPPRTFHCLFGPSLSGRMGLWLNHCRLKPVGSLSTESRRCG